MIDYQIIEKFHQGMCLDAYKVFGAHFECVNSINGVRFTVWAPAAVSVSVIGEFNDWDGQANVMQRTEKDGSIWTAFVEGVHEFEMYKYRIQTRDGRTVERSDPYAFYSELRPGTASKVYDIEKFPWNDGQWMQYRTRNFDRALNIYEAHMGSWKLKKEATEEEDGEFFSYEEMVEQLIPYVKEMGYTHIELMPLAEHPFDGSWGYQVTGYFSATSRYGNPKQLMHFIECCHQEGIGVIMDFVPAHFVKDAHGLYEFDGSCLYGYPDDYRRYSEWDTVYFDLGREEIRSFMMSSVDFWMRYFHMDGIRFDAVSNLIFWKGNKNLGLNDGAVDFMKRCNYHTHEQFPTVMTIAEDSSDYPNVTKPTVEGGLGFDYKWDLGWMNDTLKYMGRDPIYRQYHHNDFTFSMAYFYSEKFILPFSHDEVVHGKGTIIDKIHGDFDAKFAQLKTLYVYMMTHPGKKLNFMGNELGEFKEWDEKKALGWNILKYPAHDAFHHFIKDLNHLYKQSNMLYTMDYQYEGFKWMMVDNNTQSLFGYTRQDAGDNTMLVVMNFTPNKHEGLRMPVPIPGFYREVLNTDRDIYGGANMLNEKVLESEEVACIKEEDSIVMNLGSFAAAVFVLDKKKERKKAKKKVAAKKKESTGEKKSKEKKETVKKEAEKKTKTEKKKTSSSVKKTKADEN